MTEPAPLTPPSSGSARLRAMLEERNYELLGELGRGGMGIVYLARHKKLGRKVALKTLMPDRASKENSLRRFEREARTFAQIRHPHIATLYEFEDAGALQYLALEYIDGYDLESERRRGRKWTPEEGAHIIQTICTALDYTHSQGVMHRDIKPGNILIERQSNRVVLTDFGLAKSRNDETLTATGFAVGTPAYMAPEQITDQFGVDPDGRADLFSLGAVFYEMITGKHPFLGADDLKTMRAIVHTKPERPSVLEPSIPESLEAIVFRMLEKHPDNRFASAKDAAEALDRWLKERERAGQAPAPKAPSPAEPAVDKAPPAAPPPAPPSPASAPGGVSLPVLAGIVAGAVVLAIVGTLVALKFLGS